MKQVPTMPNLHHNLVQELSELMDSEWRYENFYKTDAQDCPRCLELWKRLEQRHAEDIRALKDEIASHVKEGSW